MNNANCHLAQLTRVQMDPVSLSKRAWLRKRLGEVCGGSI